MQKVGKQGTCKIKTEYVDVLSQTRLFYKLEWPLDHSTLYQELNDLIFNAHFLEDCNAEPLSDTSVTFLHLLWRPRLIRQSRNLKFDYPNYFLKDLQTSLGKVIDTFSCRSNNW